MQKIRWLLSGLMFASLVARAAVPPDLPPLIYTLTVKSETVDSGISKGLVPYLVGKAYSNAHELFLTALKQASGSDAQGFLRPLACLEGSCRRVIELPATSPPGALTALLTAEPTRTARVANITIIFDGRFFQTPINFHEAKLDASGKVVLEKPTTVTYIRTYSRSLHADDISNHRIDAPFDGKPGSREAQLHFWLAGSDPRLLQELRRSFEMSAALLDARLSPTQSGELAAALANKKNLPRVRDVTGKDANCKVLHPTQPVVKDLGDYLWLAVLGDASKVGNSFFIEPRCGFDY